MYIPGLIFILVLFIFQDRFKVISKSNQLSFNFVFYLLLGIASLVIYRTYSKAGAIALAVILILFAFMHKNRILLFMSCIVVFMIFFTESSGVYKRFERDLAIREQFGDYGKTLMFTGRVGLWEKNWDRFLYYQPIHKIFGYEGGMGTHSDYLRILLDNGIIGFILYLSILIMVFLKLMNGIKMKQDPFLWKIIVSALFSHISFVIISFGLTPSLQVDIQWFHWGIVGIALTKMRDLEKSIKSTDSVWKMK
jgi:O-antigen ligase